MDPKTLQHQFGLTHYVIQRNLDGITNKESLAHPVAGGSCLNWVLGHLVRTRAQVLEMLESQGPCEAGNFGAYGHRDAPLTEGEALPLDRLAECFEGCQAPLLEAIGKLTPEILHQPAPLSPTNDPDETIGSLLSAVAFHEAYHAGQTGVLRRMLGKEGTLGSPE